MGIREMMVERPLSIMALLHIAEEKHIRRLQLCDNLIEPLHTLNEDTLDDIRLAALDFDIQIEIGMRRLTVQNLLNYLEIARFFNSPFLRIVIDDIDYRPSLDEVIDVIHKVIDDFKKNNIILSIENHDRFAVKSIIDIIEKTDRQYVGICLDTANSLGAGEGIKEVVTALAPYTVNLHVKDFKIKRVSHKMGFIVEGCAAGEGMLNIPYILEKLKPHHRCLSATLEVWSNPLSTVERTLKREAEWVDKSLRYLKDFFL
jgi:sugar phosphate isomerase/epimerase